jgi:hypothetical protein
MDWTTFIGPTFAPAIIAGGIALIVVWINRCTTLKTHKEKFEFDKKITQIKFDLDKQLALEKVGYERQQAIFKRRFELAEQVLADAIYFASMMKFVRNGFAFGNEGESRETSEIESEDIKRQRDIYFVPLKRLNDENEFISSMFKRRYSSIAHFEEDSQQAFSLFQEALHMTKFAASSLIKYANQRSANHLIEKWENQIYSMKDETTNKDEITDKIDEAVALIEGFCKPVLEWVDTPIP